MTAFMRQFVNFQDKSSISYQLRKKRMDLLDRLVNENLSAEQELKIIDLGGTVKYWESFPVSFLSRSKIVLLNLENEPAIKQNFEMVAGDATAMPQYKDKEFDLVFSNSVIEHVGDYCQQQKMAKEVQRIGKIFFVQSPSRYFPIEPHFLFPMFQFLPLSVQTILITQFSIGHYRKQDNKEKAKDIVNSIRLLTRREMKALFPDAKIYCEKYFGITKSFIAYSCIQQNY